MVGSATVFWSSLVIVVFVFQLALEVDVSASCAEDYP